MWLDSLPHQIPFRAASALRRRSDKTIEGAFLWTANDQLPPEIMLVEAMAQFAGGLVLEGQGFLTGIDRCEIERPIEPGDLIVIEATLEAEFGGTFRFRATGTANGVEVARARFYLASGKPPGG